MAQYRYEEQPISRGKGRSAVIYAAYCHATKMRSDVEGRSASYHEKASQLVHSEIAIPEQVPDWAAEEFGVLAFRTTLEAIRKPENDAAAIREAWAKTSERLWNSVERAERELNPRFKRARYAFSTIISIPVELPTDQQIELTRGFVDSAYVRHGMCADWVIHDRNDGHPHVHVIFTTRCLGSEGWGRKMPAWASWDVLIERRGLWGQHANVRLSASRFNDRVDHRNYEARGLKLVPDTANPHFAENADGSGSVGPDEERAIRARRRNQVYLKKNPEHIVDITQAIKDVFTEEDLRRQMEKRMEVSVTATGLGALCVTDEELKELGDRALRSEKLVRVEPDAPDGSVRYMTSTKLAESEDLNRMTKTLAKRPLTTVGPIAGVNEAKHEYRGYGRRAVNEMHSVKRISLIDCRPGSNLVSALESVARVWLSRGFELCGAALTHNSKRDLAEIEGLRLRPLARWDFLWSSGVDLPKERSVFILADAAMVNVPQWSRVLNRIQESGGKLIAIRDPNRPLPVIGRSGWYAVLDGVGNSESIGKSFRQWRNREQMALAALARGGSGARNAIEHYVRKDAVRLVMQPEDPFVVLVQAYFDADCHGGSRIALGYSASDAHALNLAVRKEALLRGEVDRSAVRSYGMIERIDRSECVPRIQRVPLELGPGDQIILTRPHPEAGIPAFTLGKVLATQENTIDVRLHGNYEERGFGRHSFDLSTFRGVDYGYAATLRVAERLFAAKTFVLAHRSMHRHAVYVALTRHFEGVTFIGRPGHVESVADLIRLAQTPGHLTVGHQDVSDHPELVSRLSVERRSVAERSAHDLSPLVEAFARQGFGTGINVLEDRTILDIANQYMFILEKYWDRASPVFRGESRRYAEDPTLAVDDILQTQSSVRAAEVAERIAREVVEPETFLRLFVAAMAHPDLVTVSGTNPTGGALSYSTRKELRFVERSLRIVDDQRESNTRTLESERPGANATPDRRKPPAATKTELPAPPTPPRGLPPDRLRLIRTDRRNRVRVVSRFVRDRERYGGNVIGIAPTRDGVNELRYAGLHQVGTVREYCARSERVSQMLDGNSLVILNQASRISSGDAYALLSRQSKIGAPLVALLDDSSAGTLEDSPVFRALELRVGASRVLPDHEPNPDRSNLLRDISLDGHKRANALMDLDDGDAIHACKTVRGAVERIAENLVKDRSTDRIAVAYSQAEADAINDAVRVRLNAMYPQRWAEGWRTTKALKHLKHGDRIKFLADVLRYTVPASEPDGSSGHETARIPDNLLIRAGETAEVLYRGHHGGLRLRLHGREVSKTIELPTTVVLPCWRFAFAGSIENELPRSRDSVHILVSHRMSRQSLLSAMSMHIREFKLVLPVTETDRLIYLTETLDRSPRSQNRPVYGFESSLAARTAMDEPPEDGDRRCEPVNIALARLRTAVNLDERVLPESPSDDVISGILADVFGAATLKDGEPPSSSDRLAWEMLLNTFWDPDEASRILERLPTSLPDRGRSLAGEAVGSEDVEIPPVQAILMANSMLASRMFG